MFFQKIPYAIDQTEEQGINALVINSLESKGKIAMDAAEQLFIARVSENNEWFDAGPISLAFFRILELELNELIAIPLSADLDITILKTLFDKHIVKMKERGAGNNKLSRYRYKWEHLLEKMNLLKRKGISLELGALYSLIQNMGRRWDDPVAEMIYPLFCKNLTLEGKRAIDDGVLSLVIHPDKRERYRNPPAHTRYLSFDVATECREYVRKSVISLGRWVKIDAK